ncbi:hypothetical protein J3A83DRAFT_1004328 [Scleroderma citrinum]
MAHEDAPVLTEKVTSTTDPNPSPSKPKESFQKDNEKRDQEKPSDTEVDAILAEDSVPPVGFAQLFRYSTRFELSLGAIGSLCAIIAGAGQVLLLHLCPHSMADSLVAARDFDIRKVDPRLRDVQ